MNGYYTITRITDYGPYVTKILLPLTSEVEASEITPDKFSVYVERTDDYGRILQVPKSWMAAADSEPSKGYLTITDAYPSDLTGARLGKGSVVALEVSYGPLHQLSAGITSVDGYNVTIHSRHIITQTAEIEAADGKLSGLLYDYKLADLCPDTEGFRHSVSTYEAMPLQYAYYVPQAVGGAKPLIVWLHGAGEGGSDVRVTYTANKVTALASEKVQRLFGGAYLFVPQTPTFWMDDGCGQISLSGKSIYVEALKAAIDEFIAKNPGIDTDRIYIGGDSNGGFMTVRMLMDYPDFFAAAFPVCEAMSDDKITDADIDTLKEIPIWFTHSQDDPVVAVDSFVIPTYRRLRAAGGKDIHLTMWEHIEDIHEGFTDAEGKPYRYIGHFAWIPMLNDDCRLDYDGQPVTVGGREVTILEWLAGQKRSR